MLKLRMLMVLVQLLFQAAVILVQAAVMTILTASATLAASRQDGTNKSRRRTILIGWYMTSARMSVTSGALNAHAMVLTNVRLHGFRTGIPAHKHSVSVQLPTTILLLLQQLLHLLTVGLLCTHILLPDCPVLALRLIFPTLSHGPLQPAMRLLVA
jgi:hypothetical protein